MVCLAFVAFAAAATRHHHADHAAKDKLVARRPGALMCLARGRAHSRDYAALVQRNSGVAQQRWSSAYDHFIFHEGNVLSPHQEYLRHHAPTLRLRFISMERFWNESRAVVAARPLDNRAAWARCPPSDMSRRVSLGYKIMCLFHFGEFLHWFSAYQYVLRIDEDCVLLPGQPDPALEVRGYALAAPSISKPMDFEAFSAGIRDFFGELSASRGGPGRAAFEEWPTVYTNVLWLNTSWALSTGWMYEAVKASGCVLASRWGDAPLWGAALRATGARARTLSLRYYHGSLHAHVGYSPSWSDQLGQLGARLLSLKYHWLGLAAFCAPLAAAFCYHARAAGSAGRG